MPGEIRFGPFRVDAGERILWKHGIPVKLPEQSLAVLLLLVERPGEVVTREEIRRELWPDGTVVEFEHSINTAVGRLREALGDAAANPRYVATVPRRGYRFVGALTEEAVVQGERERRGWRASPLLGAAAVIVMALGIWAWSAHPGAEARSLCVLPLVSEGGDGPQYFADGLTLELTEALAGSGPLLVLSHDTALRYRGAGKTAREIGEELKVDAVLEGVVRRAGERLGVEVRLTEAASGRARWARTYERPLREARALADAAAEDVAAQLRSPRAERPSRAGMAKPVDAAAYDEYLRGRLIAGRYDSDGQREAAKHFEEAVRLEPDFAPALAQLSHARGMLAYWRDEPPQDEVLEPMKRALELDSLLSEAHVNNGDLLFFWQWDWEGGLAAFRRAVQLNPGSVDARRHLAGGLEIVGRREEGLAEMEAVHRMAPFSLVDTVGLAGMLHRMGRAEQALALVREGMAADPTYQPLPELLGRIHEKAGRPEEAFEAYMMAEGLSTGSLPVAEWAKAYAAGGLAGYHRKRAEVAMGRMREQVKRGRVPAIRMAGRSLEMGDRAATLGWLERAYEERSPALPWIAVRPAWDPVRGDPRFQALLRKMRLPAGGGAGQ